MSFIVTLRFCNHTSVQVPARQGSSLSSLSSLLHGQQLSQLILNSPLTSSSCDGALCCCMEHFMLFAKGENSLSTCLERRPSAPGELPSLALVGKWLELDRCAPAYSRGNCRNEAFGALYSQLPHHIILTTTVPYLLLYRHPIIYCYFKISLQRLLDTQYDQFICNSG